MEESIIMSENFNIFRNANTEITEEDIIMLSPLQLAYIGDAVYELLIRTYLLDKDLSVHKLHKTNTQYVKAEAQSNILHKIGESLTDKEIRIVKRGRNAKGHTRPKNADLNDYRYATGFEALFGYLYLTGQNERLSAIFEEIKDLDID